MKKISFILFILILFYSCSSVKPGNDGQGIIDDRISMPQTDEEVYDSMESLALTGDYAAAAEQMSHLSEEERQDEETVLLYSSLLISSGDFTEAKNELNKILKENPDNTEALLNLAIIEGINGDMDTQLSILKKIVDKEPENSVAQAAIGDIYLSTRRYNQAKKYFQASLNTEAENRFAQLGMGRVLLLEGNAEGAMVYLDAAITQDDTDALAFSERSRAKTEISDYSGADADLSHAIELMPDYYWFYIDRGKLRLSMMGEYETALKDFNMAVELNPDYFYAYLYRAQAYDLLKNYDQAIADYTRVISERDDYYYAFVPLAILYYYTEQWDNAALYFQKAYSIDNDQTFALMAGVCGLQGSNKKLTEKFIDDFIAKQERDAGFYEVGRALIENTFDGYALHVLGRMKKNDDYYRCVFYLAASYKMQGRDHLAETYYQEVVEGDKIGLLEYKLAQYELSKGGIDE